MTAPARVLYVVHGLGACGTTDLVRQLAERLDRDRFAPEVLAVRADDAGAVEASGGREAGRRAFEERAIPAHEIALPAHGSVVRRIAPIAALLRERGIQVVHAHTRPGDLWATWAGLSAGTPVRLYSRQATYGGLGRATRARYALTARAASRVVAVSEAVEEHLWRREGVPRRRIERIHDGVDFGRVDRALPREVARRRLGIARERRVVVCVASLSRRKGHADLLEAFARVRAQRPEALLLLVGDGDERLALEQRAATLGMAQGVRFLGWRDDFVDCMAAADVFALASHWEGLNLSLITASALGLPVVATNLSSNREIVAPGESGWLPSPEVAAPEVERVDAAPFADALLALLSDAALRQRMGAAGRTRARERFGAGAMAARHDALYTRLLAGTGRSPAV